MFRTIGLFCVAVLPLAVVAEPRHDFSFVNAVDNTGIFSSFGATPAINRAGAVAFRASGSGFEHGRISRWDNGPVTTIATSGVDSVLADFGETVAINPVGRVGFSARVPAASDSVIATGEGAAVTTIASASQLGIVGGQFLGLGGMNESGTVVFLGLRNRTFAPAIFSGRGGVVKTVLDTTVDVNFTGLGNVDINASGRIVFHGFPADGSEGLFVVDGGIKNAADTNHPGFTGFLDPVINERGTVGSAAFLDSGGMEVFTATGTRITARNTSNVTSADNVSINNSGDVAFFGTTAAGGVGIFLETRGGSEPVAVIQVGDPLFGSTVSAVGVGRFSLNDRDQIAFRYQLTDGRSGIAVAGCGH